MRTPDDRDSTELAPAPSPTPGAAGSPRCLLVTKEFSATPTSGGTLRTLALLEQLATRYQTTVISPDGVFSAGPGEALRELPGVIGPAGSAGRAPAADRLALVRAAPPAGRVPRAGPADALRQLRTVSRYRSISGARTAGSSLLANLRQAEGHYAVGVIDHTVLAGLADDIAAGCDQLVVSMHNIESDLMAQRTAAATSTRAKLAMRAETELLRRLEAHVADRYPVVVCTEADARALHTRQQAIVCRNGIFSTGFGAGGASIGTTSPDQALTGAGAAATSSRLERPASSMVFSGALDWGPNVDGLLWFLAWVWPLVRRQRPEATLTIAGRNPGPAVVEACATAGITLLANPPVMATVLDRHALGIVPLLSGGGSRIKILEYLAVGLNIVSTELGASGLEDIPAALLDRLPADPEAFAAGLLARLDAPVDTAVAAADWVRKHYAWDVTLRPLLDFLHRP